MPTHKGIKLSVVSQLELKIHPEWPHPDSSQFTFRSPDLRKSTIISGWTPPSASSDSKADRLLGRQSMVSVYIPSVPGARFWIRYSIVEAAAAHSQWYYFKLFMNGKHITSWGTNARTEPTGQVMRGLFEPGDRWNYKLDGVTYKNMGTETRPFFFNTEEEARSAANDGGLIEVLVFRARGRKRRMPKPTDFKDQEPFGIVMPSRGLLDKPQEARFYDWNLKDPVDNPFAIFKFHYRSWDSLISLQLIPSDHPKKLLPPTPSLLSVAGHSRELQSQLEEDDGIQPKNDSPTKSITSSINSNLPWITGVFDASPERTSKVRESSDSFVVPTDTSPFYQNQCAKQVPTSRFSQAIIDKPASPNDSPPPEYTDRPLRAIPTRNSSLRNLKTLRRQNSSRDLLHSRDSSRAPSIAPSLIDYLDRDDTFSPEPEICLASAVPVVQIRGLSPPGDSADVKPEYKSDSSRDSSENLSLVTSNTSKRQGMASTLSSVSNSILSNTNITIRKHRRSPTKIVTTLPRHISSGSLALDKDDGDEDQPTLIENMTTLSLTESEWMCRTPSPVRNDPEHARVERLWSPGLDGEKRNSNPNSNPNGEENHHPLRKRALEWYDKIRYVDGKPGVDQDKMGMLPGNWI